MKNKINKKIMAININKFGDYKSKIKRNNNFKSKMNNEHKFYFIKNVPKINFSILIIFILLPSILSKITRQKALIYSYELTIKIEGTGTKAIVNGDIADPSQIVINGQSQSGVRDLNLNTSPTTIKIIWDSAPTTCNRLFADFSNLLYADFSNFDSSQVDNMNQMFAGCTSLTSINFNGLDTSSVTIECIKCF